MMPPPGWTCLASSGGTVGERSRQPSRSSSKAGQPHGRDGAVVDVARPGRAAVAFGEAGPVGEVVARRRRRGRRRSGGRARPAPRRDHPPGPNATRRTCGPASRRPGPAWPRGRAGGRSPGPRPGCRARRGARPARRASPARARRSARPRARPAPRSPPAAAAAARSSSAIRGANSGCSHSRSSAHTRCSVCRISQVMRMPSASAAATHLQRERRRPHVLRLHRQQVPQHVTAGRVQPLAARPQRRFTHRRRTPRSPASAPACATRPRPAPRASTDRRPRAARARPGSPRSAG